VPRRRRPADAACLLGGLVASLCLFAAVGADPVSLRRAEVTLSEAVYLDEFLREPARAAELYQIVLSEANATRQERHEAGWRLGRAWRRLNQPAEARTQLGSLLIDPELPEDLRAIVERELHRIPRAEPARLMSSDSLVYLEIPQPGIFLERCLSLVRGAGLERSLSALQPMMLGGVGALPTLGALNVRPFWHPSVRSELSKLDALGIAWRDFRFEPAEEGVLATSEVVCTLHTGGGLDAAETVEMLLGAWLAPQPDGSHAGMLNLTDLNPELRLKVADGLLVVSSDERAGSAALQRYRSNLSGDSLYVTNAYQRRPTGWPHPDGAFVFVNWQPLLGRLFESMPDSNPAALRATAELMGLHTIGPLFGMLTLRDETLTAELMIELNEPQRSLGQALRTPPLPPGWSRWVPDEAWFACVLSVERGDERWRAIESFTGELDEYVGQARGRSDPNVPAATFRGVWSEFQSRTGLSIADDLCAELRTLTVVALPESRRQSWAAPWVFVLEMERPERWLRQVETALGRWFLPEGNSAVLPTVPVTTPAGEVTHLTIPGAAGLAWQVRGSRVVIAFGVESLVRYLQAIPSAGGSDYAPGGRPVCKYYRGQLDASLINMLYPIPLREDDIQRQLPPLEVWTLESDQRVHFTVRQRDSQAAVRYLAQEWFGLSPDSASVADPLRPN
jgi:hypothetical protein